MKTTLVVMLVTAPYDPADVGQALTEMLEGLPGWSLGELAALPATSGDLQAETVDLAARIVTREDS